MPAGSVLAEASDTFHCILFPCDATIGSGCGMRCILVDMRYFRQLSNLGAVPGSERLTSLMSHFNFEGTQ